MPSEYDTAIEFEYKFMSIDIIELEFLLNDAITLGTDKSHSFIFPDEKPIAKYLIRPSKSRSVAKLVIEEAVTVKDKK